LGGLPLLPLENRAAGGQAQHVEVDPVLGALRPGKARLDRGEIEFQDVGEDRVGHLVGAPQPLRLGIGLDQGHSLGAAPGQGEIAEGLPVDREEAAGGAVFRGHVADRRPVGEGELGQPRTEELDELADHAELAQHLGDGEHQVGGGHPLLEPAAEAEADHFGDDHRDRLAEHRRLGLDAAHPPAENGQAIDHGGVAVGSDQGVGVGDPGSVPFLAPDRARQILEVDLVADAGSRRHHPEIIEGELAPAQESVALEVALHLHLDVDLESLGVGVAVDHHRMVDDQVDRNLRIDLLRVAAGALDRVAHRRQVDHRRHPGEILHQDPGGGKGDFVIGFLVFEPAGQGADVRRHHRLVVLGPQQVLQQHLEGEGEPGDVAQARFGRGRQAEIVVAVTAGLKRAAGFEAVRVLDHRYSPVAGLSYAEHSIKPNAACPTGGQLVRCGKFCYQRNRFTTGRTTAWTP